MSTIGYSDWAVDLADVGPVYPFQGLEGLMVLVGVVFWLGWHVVQFRRESVELAALVADHAEPQAHRTARGAGERRQVRAIRAPRWP